MRTTSKKWVYGRDFFPGLFSLGTNLIMLKHSVATKLSTAVIVCFHFVNALGAFVGKILLRSCYKSMGTQLSLTNAMQAAEVVDMSMSWV